MPSSRHSISFSLSTGKMHPWECESVAEAVMKQGRDQRIEADAEIRGTELGVDLYGDDQGRLIAFEAAVRSWFARQG